MVNNDLYNEDELNPPDWLNETFFEKILKNVETENATVTNLLLRPGTLKNDHYASVLFRAKVNYTVPSQPKEEREQSFILKVEPFADGYKKDIVGDLSLFQTEIIMYTKVLPKIEELLRRCGDDTVLGPKLVAYNSTAPSYVIFEDLALKGYTTIGHRHTSLEEVRTALLKLAKLHAISYKLGLENDNVITSMDKGSMNSIDPNSFEFIKIGIELLKEVISEHSDLREFIPHIEAVEHLLLPKSIEMFNKGSSGAKRDGIFVLNHGDFHMKNVMIQNSDGKLRDLMLLDYQISVFGSPAIDLHYAFTMMYSPEMRRDHHDELLYFYITNFQETLRKSEYRGHIPTNVEFRQELEKHRYWGLFLLLSFLIFSYSFSDADGDLAKVIEDKAEQKKQLRDPRLLNELRELLPKFLYNGYFEY
uniref:CHK kinase-like domain-containing protein n=3 Tax=Ceratitis capitata TaxID=7213 RepID=W8BQG4_CERCA